MAEQNPKSKSQEARKVSFASPGSAPNAPPALKSGSLITEENSPVSFVFVDEHAIMRLKKEKQRGMVITKARKFTNTSTLIIVASVIAFMILIIMYGMSATQGGKLNFVKAKQDYIMMAFIVLLAPYAIYDSTMLGRLDRMEDKFPDFLKDMAEYWRGGLSMTSAIDTISRGEYGALNKEVRKMANQISWGIAFEDVLKMFATRVSTPIIERSISLVIEANKAGGKIADILLTAANDAREIRWLKDDRRRNLSMYTMVVYISFVVYLAVIVIICLTFLPAIDSSGTAGSASGGAASQPGGGGVSSMMQALDVKEINFIFFSSSVVQAIGNGMMAGAMSEGSKSAGMKHAAIMTLMVWVIFRGASLV